MALPNLGYSNNPAPAPSSGGGAAAPKKGGTPPPLLGTWDYKTATAGPKGEETPKGAQGWTPEGNPYFGEGVKGKLKEYAWMMTKDIPQVDASVWDEIKGRWQQANKNAEGYSPIAYNQDQAEANSQKALETGGLIVDTVKTAWQAASAEGSLISPVVRGVGVTVKAVGDLFSIPAIGLERAIGAKEGFQEAANSVDSPLPRMDSNWFTKLIEETPLGLAYDFTRIALSSSENKWEQAKTGIEEGWQAGRIFYSQVFDATIKEEFLRRYRGGENAELLAMELQNPMAELGGQFFLDPTNLLTVWAKGAKVAGELDKAQEALKATGLLVDKDAVNALKLIGESTDEATIVKHWDTVVAAQQKAVEAIEGGRLLNNTFTKDALTQGSRVKVATAKASDFFGLMTSALKKEGMGFNDVAEAIRAGVLSVSKNSDEMQAGLSALSHLPSSHLWMNDDALTSFTLIRNLITNEQGAIDGSKLLRLMDKKSLPEFAQEASRLISQAAHTQFPDVQEMKTAARLAEKAAKTGAEISTRTKEMAQIYNDLSPAVKVIDEVNNIISKPKNWINSMLAMDYFGLRGGAAVKNVASNMEMILVDKGASAWVKDVVKADGTTKKAYWSLGAAEEFLDDIYGFKLSATSGFDTLTKAESGVKAAGQAESWRDKILFGSKIMEKGEAAASTRIVAAAVRDTMNKLLKPGLALPPLETLTAAGLNEKQANMFAKFMMHFNGDGEKALEAFRGLYGAGNGTDEWRHLDFLTKTQDGALKDLGFFDDMMDFARTGGNDLGQVEDYFNSLRKAVMDRAGEAVKDMVGVSQDHPALDLIGHLDDEVRAGNLDAASQEVFKAVMQASQNAKNEFMEKLNQTIRLVTNRLSMNGRLDEATQLGQDYDKIFKAFMEGGNQTKTVTTEALMSTRSWSAEIKAFKDPTPADLVSYWKRANLKGEPPLDLTKQSLLENLWRQHREKVSADWNVYFDTLFAQSEDMVKGFSNYMDATEIQSDFSRARHAVTQAQAYREAVYEAGRLRINPKNDVNWLAQQYGISSATEEGASKGNAVLNLINKYVGTSAPDDVRVVRNFEKAVESPISHLPEPVANRFKEEAQRLLNELTGGTGPGVSKGAQGSDQATQWFGSTNVEWYKNLPENMQNKPALEKAFNKIISGEGDSGPNVQRLKEIIIENFKFGDSASGTPPDLNVLQEMDVPKDIMQKALDNFNEITGQNLSMNEAIRKSGGAPTKAKYAKLEDVPYEVAKAAFERRRVEKGLPEVNLTGIAIPPPATETISFARGWNENAPGALQMLDEIKTGIIERFGKKTPGAFDPSIEAALKNYVMESADKVSESRAIALKIATEQRNFTLLNYGEKTYADVAKSYLLPYHFFYSRQYKNLIPRIAQNPHLVAGYAKYKNFLESTHKDMPDWYKQQVNINPFAQGAVFEKPGAELLGIPMDHPLFINLEASLNPLYGLTGTDFNDPGKRVDWFSATVDDMGKFGPSLWAPLQMAMAGYYTAKGQEDAAARWGSRLVPITNEIKTASSFLPFLNKPIELDPATLIFGGGYDPYERSRIGTEMLGMQSEQIQKIQDDPNLTRKEKDQLIGEIQAQADDAMYNQQGELWDAAYKGAVQNRAGTVFGGWMMGVGFKPRSTADVMQEQMFTDLNRLYAVSDSLAPDQYRQEYDKLLSKYPGMEAALLSRKGGDKRDSAYAYNVLGRLPPGKINNVLTAVGLNPDDIAKFYDSKGFTNKDVSWTPAEKMRFMAAVVDLSAMLNIPPDATRQEWTAAKNAYTDAQEQIKGQFGDDIWDVVSHYYDLKDDNPQQADEFRQEHPEISQALTMMQQQKVMNPLLSAYYGGIDVVEAYVSGNVRSQLTQEYGQDIYDLQTEYFNRKVADPADAKNFLNQHPELRKFWNRKAELDEAANRQFLSMAGKIPEGQGIGIRPGFEPQSGAQEDLLNAAQGDQQMSWDQLSQAMSPQLQERLYNYWTQAEPLTKAANDELDYAASKLGLYNGDALLRRAGLAIMGGGGFTGQTAPGQPNFSLGY